MLRPTSAAICPVRAYWCAIGTSGTTRPTCLANWAPQNPAAHTTMSASMTPLPVRTPVTRPPASTMPSTSVCGRKVAPRDCARQACASAARTRLGQAVGGRVEPAEDAVAVQQRMQLDAFGRRQQPPSIPHAAAQPALRCRSAQRSGVVATSRPPTGLNAHPPGCSSALNFSTV